METLINIVFTTDFGYSILRLMTPILFVSLAALVAQQSGITNMALEGTMLFSALFGVIGSAFTQSAWLGLLLAIAVGIVISLVLAYAKIRMKTDEILAAIAINLLASGATVFILFLVSGDRGTSASLASVSMPIVHIPLIKDIPVLGEIISGQNILVYIALISVVVLNFILFKTPLGLRIRAVGGNPDAASSVGVSVEKTQYIALALSGVLAGMAGAYMSMGYLNIFTRDMSAGRGFIGLAAASVGGQNPIGALFASILFGSFDALGNNLQITKLPAEFIYMIPYIMTIVAYSYSSYRKMNEKKRNQKKLAKETSDELKTEDE